MSKKIFLIILSLAILILGGIGLFLFPKQEKVKIENTSNSKINETDKTSSNESNQSIKNDKLVLIGNMKMIVLILNILIIQQKKKFTYVTSQTANIIQKSVVHI